MKKLRESIKTTLKSPTSKYRKKRIFKNSKKNFKTQKLLKNIFYILPHITKQNRGWIFFLFFLQSFLRTYKDDPLNFSVKIFIGLLRSSLMRSISFITRHFQLNIVPLCFRGVPIAFPETFFSEWCSEVLI